VSKGLRTIENRGGGLEARKFPSSFALRILHFALFLSNIFLSQSVSNKGFKPLVTELLLTAIIIGQFSLKDKMLIFYNLNEFVL